MKLHYKRVRLNLTVSYLYWDCDILLVNILYYELEGPWFESNACSLNLPHFDRFGTGFIYVVILRCNVVMMCAVHRVSK